MPRLLSTPPPFAPAKENNNVLLLLALPVFVGNQACAACHADIAAKYRQTPMAQTSGHVSEVTPGSFRHAPSGTQYQVESSGKVRLSRGTSVAERLLQYFIG